MFHSNMEGILGKGEANKKRGWEKKKSVSKHLVYSVCSVQRRKLLSCIFAATGESPIREGNTIIALGIDHFTLIVLTQQLASSLWLQG